MRLRYDLRPNNRLDVRDDDNCRVDIAEDNILYDPSIGGFPMFESLKIAVVRTFIKTQIAQLEASLEAVVAKVKMQSLQLADVQLK